ncbi:MAG: hypothetical protein HC802_04735 [Caldilineaceae bacterium]|nr:hypothetical protein [Caldilineaceae bacterium]
MHLEQALSLAREVGAHEFLNTAIAFLAVTLTAQGELTQAETLLHESSVLTGYARPHKGQNGSRRLVLCAQAELLLAQGEVSDALALAEELIATSPYADEGGVIPRLWLLRGRALAARQQAAEAEQSLRDGIETAQRQTLRPLLWRLQVELGRLFYAQRQTELGQIYFDAARAVVNSTGRGSAGRFVG